MSELRLTLKGTLHGIMASPILLGRVEQDSVRSVCAKISHQDFCQLCLIDPGTWEAYGLGLYLYEISRFGLP
jgi:hypothetical protein